MSLCDQVLPLDDFPPAMRQRIADAVADDVPPARYIYLGSPESGRPMAQIESRAWWEWHWTRGVHPELQRSRLPNWLRRRVIARDGLRCGLCQGDVPLSDVHIDHRIPVARGGTDDPANLQVTHSLCNLRKGSR